MHVLPSPSAEAKCKLVHLPQTPPTQSVFSELQAGGPKQSSASTAQPVVASHKTYRCHYLELSTGHGRSPNFVNWTFRPVNLYKP